MVVSVRNRNCRASLRRRRERGALLVELSVAIAILIAGMIPLGLTILHDHKRARNLYTRAIAMQIVDGEMEVLAAGEWRDWSEGTHDYQIPDVAAAGNLPKGAFILTRDARSIRLEWKPERRNSGGGIRREFELPTGR